MIVGFSASLALRGPRAHAAVTHFEHHFVDDAEFLTRRDEGFFVHAVQAFGMPYWYGLPTIDQAPPIEVVLVEIPSPPGPLGAKGVGEPPAVPGPAAVANAIRAAVGVRIQRLPIDAELIATAGRRE